MLSEDTIEKVTEVLATRMNEVNTYILDKIGTRINKIGALTSSSSQELVQLLQYGGDLDDITRYLSDITNKSVQDIYEMFEEVAKTDLNFAKQFYDVKELGFIPFDENILLQEQVKALARITAVDFINITNTLAFRSYNEVGKVIYTDLARTYQIALDKAVLSIGQGKDTFYNQMHKTIKDLGKSGVRTVDYASGYSRRLDSSVRSAMFNGLKNMNMTLRTQFGEEYGADGVQLTLTYPCALDHIPYEGRQYSYEEFEKINQKLLSQNEREFFTLNCRHSKYDIIMGVNKPQYTDEFLNKKHAEELKTKSFEGKDMAQYEASQLQRKIETQIRQTKDEQIFYRSTGDLELVGEAQRKITALTNKYKSLSDTFDLPVRTERLRVSGYRRVATK